MTHACIQINPFQDIVRFIKDDNTYQLFNKYSNDSDTEIGPAIREMASFAANFIVLLCNKSNGTLLRQKKTRLTDLPR